MAGLLFILLGVVLTLGTIVGWAVYLTVTGPARSEAQLARLEQLRAERRIQQLTQDAVAQMFDIARGRR
jgi:hypothetical protein